MAKNPRNAMTPTGNITACRTAARFPVNSRGFARNERTPGTVASEILPRRGSPMRNPFALESGLPLRGRCSLSSPFPGVEIPGYSWRNRAAARLKRLWPAIACWVALLVLIFPRGAGAAGTVIIVTGAPGGAEFADGLAKQSSAWREAAQKGDARVVEIGVGGEDAKISDAEKLRTTLTSEKPDGQDALWLVLNGHGTWDGKIARFNLRGPDVSADDLADWLKPINRPAAIINTASSSAPFMAKLAAPGRIVITATRSGSEQNLTRFGKYLTAVLTDKAADLDTDGSVSLLEAFLAASRKTTEFYQTESRLATEHALIDDNGDGLGTPADWFKGLRAAKKSDKNAVTDGAAARHFYLIPPVSEKQWPPEKIKQRTQLEARLAALREEKAAMKGDDYYAQVEVLLLELARLAADGARTE